MNFDKFISNDAATETESIKTLFIKDEKYLDSSYMVATSDILFRDEEMNKLASIVTEGLKKKTSFWINMVGDMGLGKTTIVMSFFKELKQFVTANGKNELNFDYAYTSARVSKSQFRIIKDLTEKLGISKGGQHVSDYYREVQRYVEKTNMPLILIIDEFDKMKETDYNDFITVFYDMASYLSYRNSPPVCMVTIGNVQRFKQHMLDGSRMTIHKDIRLKPYSQPELFGILKDKMTKSLNKPVSEEVLLYIIKLAAKENNETSNMRYVIKLLKTSAILAQRDGTDLLSYHVEEAINVNQSSTIKETLSLLPPQTVYVLKAGLLATKSGTEDTTTMGIYNHYVEVIKSFGREPLTKRMIHEYIDMLENYDVLKTETAFLGRGGKKNIVTLSKDKVQIVREFVNKAL